MKLFLGIFAAFALVAAIASAQSIPVVGPTTHTFSGSGQSNVWTCPNGQSSFQLTMPTGMTGTLAVTTSQSSTAPTPWPSPPIAYAPGPVFTNTLTNSGTLTLTLGSNYFINVTVSNYVSGSTTVIGSCSAATAGNPQLQTRFDVRYYGAKSNGTTDDSVAVQAAEDACNAAGGGTVYFPAGTTLAKNITFYSFCQNNAAAIGGAIVKLPNAANVPVFVSQNFASLTGTNSVGGVSDTGFSNITIDGNKANQSAGAACVQYYGFNPVFLHTRVQNCYGDGWYSEWGCCSVPSGAAAAMINDVRSLNNGQNGITWKGPHDAMWQDVVTNLNGNDGVFVSGQGEGLLITQFHSWGTTQSYALYLDTAIASVICNSCILEGATVSQYFVDGPFNAFSGQMYNAAGTSTDMTIGGSNGAGTGTINANINTPSGQTGAIIVWGNDNGQNQIAITAFCSSSTPATSGSQGTNDIIQWTSQGCSGAPNNIGTSTMTTNTLAAHFGGNLALRSAQSSAHTGSVDVNNNSGSTNNDQGIRVFDGSSTNALQIIPVNLVGIATLQFSSGAPVGACVPGSTDLRVDTSAATTSEFYVCTNVTGTGTWQAALLVQPSPQPPNVQAGYLSATGAFYGGTESGVGISQTSSSCGAYPSPSPNPYWAFVNSSGTYVGCKTQIGTVSNAQQAWQENNQSTIVTDETLNSLTFSGVASLQVAALATPPAPAPTCTPGGALGSHTVFVQMNYANANGRGIVNAESSVTCGANTLAYETPPPGVAGGFLWNVYAGATSGSEQLQTNGTSMNLSTPWTEPTGGPAGSGSPPPNDAALATFKLGNVVAIPENGTSTFNGVVQGCKSGSSGTSTCAKGTYPPVFLHDGTTVTTAHCVFDTVTGGVGTTTVTYTSPATFAAATYTILIQDTTTLGTPIAPATQATGSFSFVSTSGHIYAYSACGA